jgi:hypothetical protein
VAAVNSYITYRVSRRQAVLERLKGAIQEDLSERNALIAYQFGARKRLYEECGPAFFQLREAADEALRAIVNLCDPEFREKLRPDDENGARNDLFILSKASAVIATLYGILRPIAIYATIREKITDVDVSLDPSLAFRYQVARQLMKIYSEDAQLAALHPTIAYTPLLGHWRDERKDNPARWWWQGTSPGRLDNAISLLIEEHGAGKRVMTFGAFERLYEQTYHADAKTQKQLGVVANPLYGFTPEDRPVFQRMLLAKAFLYAALVRPTPGNIDIVVTERKRLAAYLQDALVACPHFTASKCADFWSPEARKTIAFYLADQLLMPPDR